MRRDKESRNRRKVGVEKRIEQRAAKTDKQQLTRLNAHGYRALKERARLAARIKMSSK